MKTFDYVVVGAGASGCVIASRLSEDPRKEVLVVEAGGNNSSFKVRMPRAFPKALSDPALTFFYPAVRPGRNEPEVWLRGRGVGGSTTVNGLLYTRGFRKDYDEWAANGCAGWSWADMAPCFRAVEGNPLGEADWRGGEGPFRVSEHPDRTGLNEAVIGAAAALGVPRRGDLNEADDEGFGYNLHSTSRGRRTTAATAFLHPALGRSNLTLLTESEVQRVTFEGGRANGVVVRTAEGTREIPARNVILCAGAIVSPKLLMLSGIGPADQLTSAGVPVLINATEVGQNMREHLLLSLQFGVSHGSSNLQLRAHRLLWNVVRWYLRGSGPLSYGATEFGGFIKVRPQSDRPDAQLMGSPFMTDRRAPGFVIDGRPGFTLGGYVVRPQGRGQLRLQSADPATPPLLAPNYLDGPDREIAAGLVRWIRRLAAQAPLSPYQPQELFPGPEYANDDEIVAAFHQFGGCGFHAIGTCRMGSDAGSVVDPRLRVRGVDGLRVADISAMPSMPSGNTQAPALAFAWRAADLIRDDA